MASFDREFECLNRPLIDIQTATNNFADENIVRRDGFGNEYKGHLVLRSGNLIDIIARRLDTKISGHGFEEFVAEIIMLSSLKHQNLVSIVGFCDENDEKIVIYKFEARLSLDRYISDPVTLTWARRLEICLGIARVLSYIHYEEGRNFSVIHRDIKSSKILLDENWEAKLSGFELATMQPSARRHYGVVVDLPCGTPGYVDPTYETSGSVTLKSDVYSFGVLLFGVLSGTKASNLDNSGLLLAKLAKSHYENGSLNDIICPGLPNQMNSQALKAFSEAAYSCLNEQHSQRPNADQVILALEQALELQLAYESTGKNLEHLKIGLDAIEKATENFSKKYLVEEDVYGAVYRAELEHFDSFAMKGNKATKFLHRRRSTVAIKHIFTGEGKQGDQGFLTEESFYEMINALSSCVHPNIVSFLGFCYEHPHMFIVYEYVPNGSLDDYLKKEENLANLTWGQRIKICIDIARGIDYLHTATEYKQEIIHGDIKSANVLLGENGKAKISNFEHSKLNPHTRDIIYKNIIAGTDMYIDPEYESAGYRLGKESDVYGFGVVLFEILTGRLAYDSVYIGVNEKGLAPIVRQDFKSGTIKELVDPKLNAERDNKMFSPSGGPNEDSLHTFCNIGYRCLAEKQDQRPSMKDVIQELYRALYFQVPSSLQISFEELKRATQDFSVTKLIGKGGFGRAYRGKFSGHEIVAKRNDTGLGQGEEEFLTEIELLYEYKHQNVISLVGYCKKDNERILVYEHAENGSLDRHVKHASLTWTKRLKICIDVAMGLDFLHTGNPTHAPVIHRDLKSTNILLNDDWKAKIGDFGLSIITRGNNEFDVITDTACGTYGYVDPLYLNQGSLSRESDIYSLGVILFEILCGRIQDRDYKVVDVVKSCYEEGKVGELVLEGLKDKISRESLTTFVKVAYECLHDERLKRPTAREVVLQLKKAMEIHLLVTKLNDLISSMSREKLEFEMLMNEGLGGNPESEELKTLLAVYVTLFRKSDGDDTREVNNVCEKGKEIMSC